MAQHDIFGIKIGTNNEELEDYETRTEYLIPINKVLEKLNFDPKYVKEVKLDEQKMTIMVTKW